MMARVDAGSQAQVPSFCSHEHWGSIDAIGKTPEGFRADVEWGARPSREAGLMDLLCDPYLHGWLGADGFVVDAMAKAAGHDDIQAWGKAAPAEARKALGPAFREQRLTGTYQCLRRGIQSLYDTDIEGCDDHSWAYLDARVGHSYGRLFAWYREAQAMTHFTELIRPAQPEMYWREANPESAAEERAFTRTVMRVDPLLDLWPTQCPRRDELARLTGVDPTNAESWRAFIAAIFARIEQGGAVGTKQAQAYRRPLEFRFVEDKDVVWRGDLNPLDVRVFQDWVMNECLRQTAARGWPHQCHVGTHNLPQSNPLPLDEVAKRYPKMKLVLIHCWPYLNEAGWLAKHHPNVFLDACWQVILNPDVWRQALHAWLGYVPLHKLTVGHDATSVEMAAGAYSIVREILGDVLGECSSTLGLRPAELTETAVKIMHNNAVSLYGFGEML